MSAKNVVNLLDRPRRKVPELTLDIPVQSAAVQSPNVASYVVPADRPKLVLAIGSGQTGKSTMIRWIAEQATERGSEMALATLAPNRTLRHYFPSTICPEGNSTSAGATFLEMLIDVAAESKLSAVIDFPGDDTALLHLLDQGLDPTAMLADAGVELVVLYTLSPRVEDLTAMAQLTAHGFKPKATALVCNMGLTRDPTLPPRPQFDAVTEHSVYCAAMERGAAEIWMPRLFSAASIEENRLLFSAARDGTTLHAFDRSRTFHWLREMQAAFAPIASWLP